MKKMGIHCRTNAKAETAAVRMPTVAMNRLLGSTPLAVLGRLPILCRNRQEMRPAANATERKTIVETWRTTGLLLVQAGPTSGYATRTSARHAAGPPRTPNHKAIDILVLPKSSLGR
jgi:hypothetical protein